MNTFSDSITAALELIRSADPVFLAIVARSLAVSAAACVLACGAGLVLGAWLGVARFAGRGAVRAVKAVSTYRGRDPRDCVLLAFGGNGGLGRRPVRRSPGQGWGRGDLSGGRGRLGRHDRGGLGGHRRCRLGRLLGGMVHVASTLGKRTRHFAPPRLHRRAGVGRGTPTAGPQGDHISKCSPAFSPPRIT